MSALWEMERGDLIREVEELAARLAAQQPVIDAMREIDGRLAFKTAEGAERTLALIEQIVERALNQQEKP